MKRNTPPISTRRIVNVLTPELAKKMLDFRFRIGVLHTGYPVLKDWHPVMPEGWGEFPAAPFKRSVVYRGNTETWAYSHHMTLAKFNGQYVVSWSNGFLHEDYVGQEVHYATSTDGATWSKPGVVVATPVESKLVRNNAGLCAADGKLFCYVGVAKDFGRDVSAPGMVTLKEQHIRLDAYETSDLKSWTRHENLCESIYLFEGPRRTRGGRYVCCGADLYNHHPMVLIWENAAQLAGRPRVLRLPISKEGVDVDQVTWYQTDDGRIWMFIRDGSLSCRLGLMWSDDEGDTWSEQLFTDFPNTYSRAYAGRLTDGRYFIAGNNYDVFLDRRYLLLALSDDGLLYDRQYLLVGGDTTRRINGRHKEDGFHYPNCLVDGDRLLVTYSVNKEDIEVGLLDTKTVK